MGVSLFIFSLSLLFILLVFVAGFFINRIWISTNMEQQEVTEDVIAAAELLYCGGGMIAEKKQIPVRVSQTALHYGAHNIQLAHITDVEIMTNARGGGRRFWSAPQLVIRYTNGVKTALVLSERGMQAKGLYVIQSALLHALSKEKEKAQAEHVQVQDKVIKGFLL
jgi:hypothetical protein